MSRAAGAALAVTGFLACPCHLAITLPLLVSLFGGTAVGAFLTANTGLIALAATAYFIGGLGLGWYLLTREKPRAAKTVRPASSLSCCPPAFELRQDRLAAVRHPEATEDTALAMRR